MSVLIYVVNNLINLVNPTVAVSAITVKFSLLPVLGTGSIT